MAASYGWAAAIFGILAILGLLYWAYRRATNREIQLERETKARLESEATRAKEEEIRRVQEQIRREPGPAVPNLGGVRDGTHRQDSST